MKREILFRAKKLDFVTLKPTSEWVEGLLMHGANADEYIIQEPNKRCHLVDGNTIGEFTGKTDKNGKKIFEGDICKVTYLDKRCNSNGEHYFMENELIEEVVILKSAFCFKVVFEDIAMYRPIGFDIYEKQDIKHIEVIGNVYDNPDKIQGEKHYGKSR